ncbi:hypothetical protein SUDANB105_07549 [Streptomyces sp. enrichment culture]|uniref:hypothetical protein n=1 Tax=Streptomyces sp. enrichment culture TaxID=1795815 RepID=UPI003F55920D
MSAVPTPNPPPPFPSLPDERLVAGVARLATRHAGRFSAWTVTRLLADSYQRPAGTASVTTHLVAPAERFTAERLDALACVQGAPGAVLQRVPTAFRSEASASPGRHRYRHRPRITDSLASLPST